MRFAIIFLLSLAVATTTGRNVSAQQNKSHDARFALVIGNAKYPDSDAPLKDAITDAQEMAKELRRDRFDVDVGENLSKNAMRSALDRLYGKIKSGSVAVIFFSGYGIQSDRQSYMIPVDAQIWSEADVRRDGFSMDKILHEMDQRGANIKVAILNASRRNPFERRFRAVPAGLAPVVTPRNTMIMYSAAPGTVASLAAAAQRSFVTELIKQMRTPGLSGEEVFNGTRFSVARASRDQQTPWLSSSLVEKFYFSPDASRDTKPEVAKTLPPEREPNSWPTPAVDPEAQARRDYLRADQIGTRNGWNDFLNKHPTGQYAILAEDKLAKLNASRDSKTQVANTSPPEREPNSWPTPAIDPEAQARGDYLRAEQIGTRSGWNDFLNKHPTGQYATLAQDKLAKLNSPGVLPKPPEAGKVVPIEQGTKDDEAIRELDRRLQSHPKDVDAHYKRGTLYAKNGEYLLAIKDFNEVIRFKPNNADALNNRCWVQAMLDDFQSALKDCSEALRIRPRFANALDSRALVKLKIGQPQNALTDYDASLRINANQASSLYGRGIAKIRSGNVAGGNSDIAAAKSINPRISEEFARYGIR
jgi:tetratricopeptide (TPR) repeat protein